jgi:hypothetical protein
MRATDASVRQERDNLRIIVFGFVIYRDIAGNRYQMGFGLQYTNVRPSSFYFYGEADNYNYDRKMSDLPETYHRCIARARRAFLPT